MSQQRRVLWLVCALTMLGCSGERAEDFSTTDDLATTGTGSADGSVAEVGEVEGTDAVRVGTDGTNLGKVPPKNGEGAGDAGSDASSTALDGDAQVAPEPDAAALPDPTALLSVSTTGGGSGQVSSEAIGLACTGSCTNTLPLNTQVTLVAEPDAASSSFQGFTGGSCSVDGASCTVVMSEARTVAARFELLLRALNVSVGGNGSGNVTARVGNDTANIVDCRASGGDCSESVAHGGLVVLTAAPAANSTFVWGGACSGSATTCTLPMDQARNVSATFTLRTFTLRVTVTAGPNAGGTVQSSPAGIDCSHLGGTCSATFTVGTKVTLTATPEDQSGNDQDQLDAWGGACSTSSSETCEVIINSDTVVSARFHFVIG